MHFFVYASLFLFLFCSCSPEKKQETTKQETTKQETTKQETKSETTKQEIKPFEVNFMLKKSEQKQFQEFDPNIDAIEENDELKLKFHANKDAYFAIFWRDSEENVYQMFPEEGQSVVLTKKDATISLPPEEGLIFTEAQGDEFFCCFHSSEPVNVEKLLHWLRKTPITMKADQTIKLRDPIVEGGASPPPCPLYLIKFSRK